MGAFVQSEKEVDKRGRVSRAELIGAGSRFIAAVDGNWQIRCPKALSKREAAYFACVRFCVSLAETAGGEEGRRIRIAAEGLLISS